MDFAVTIEPTAGVTIWKGPGPAPAGGASSAPIVFDAGKERIVFGRDNTSDVVFGPEHRAVGRKHCELLRQPAGGYRIEIFGERAVEINGAPARSGETVPDGARIRFGGASGPTVVAKIAKGAATVADRELTLIQPKFETTGQSVERMRLVRTLVAAPFLVVAAPFILAGMGIGAAASGLKRVAGNVGRRQAPQHKSDRPPPESSARQIKAAPDRSTSSGARAANLVEVSAFAPPSAVRGTDVLVQVFLHGEGGDAIVAALAIESDPSAGRKGKATLSTGIDHGQRVTVSLEAGGMAVDEPVQDLIWRGGPSACQFFVTVPRDVPLAPIPFRVRVLIETVPVGSIRFRLLVGDAQPSKPVDPVMVGDAAVRYRHAFISYASEDRTEVLKRAQALKAARIGFFQDLLSLDPGERWERRLFEEIDRCDLFLLFWSSGAAKSKWVLKEAEYALERRNRSGGRPDITPVVLEGPPVPPCPEILRDIHFNDPLVYVIAAVDAERRALQ